MKEPKKYTAKELATGVVSILVLWIVVTVSCEDNESKEKEAPEFGKIEAYNEVKVYVTKQLISPSTADFPWYDDSFVSEIDDTTFAVRSYVDSQNSYGAMIRSNFGSKVIYHPKSKLVEIDYLTIK